MQQHKGGSSCRACNEEEGSAQSLPLMLTLPRNCALVTCHMRTYFQAVQHAQVSPDPRTVLPHRHMAHMLIMHMPCSANHLNAGIRGARLGALQHSIRQICILKVHGLQVRVGQLGAPATQHAPLVAQATTSQLGAFQPD